MFDTILVPTDGSEPAEAAIDTALTLANRFDAALHAIHVSELGELLDDIQVEPSSRLIELAESSLASIDEQASDVDVPVSTDIIEKGDAVHQAIVDYADGHDVDLIVMGTHGRTGFDRVALGSVTARTLRISPIPVLTVAEGVSIDPNFEAVLVPTDGSEGAIAAAEHGINLCKENDAALHVVHVIDLTPLWGNVEHVETLEALEEYGQRAVDNVVQRADAAGLQSIRTSVLSGTAARSIVDYADDRNIDLIVMGTHGRTGLERYLVGSVTENVVRLAECPVLTLSTHETE